MESKHYDVFVIGSGVAGQTAAKVCAKNNLKVAIADKREFGGTCSNRGCDPKKILLQFADLVKKSKQLKGLGVKKIPKINWGKIQEFKSNYTNRIPKATEENLTELEIDLYHQSPKFITKNEITVEGKKITADKFVIASGLVPRKLSFDGAEFLETSDDILKLKKIPKSAIFIGSGYVGMEFCYLLSTLGCKVTMIDKGSNALSLFDNFLTSKLVEDLEKNGVEFIFDATIKSVQKLKKNKKITFKTEGKTKSIKARKIINTSGRVPAIELLNLKKAGINADKTGVIVDNFLNSKTNKNVYACGDVSSKSLPLTPLSGLQGYIVGNNIVNSNTKKFTDPLVPSVVFTNPNLASVGYSENEAKNRYKDIIVYKGDAKEWYSAKKENADTYAYKIIINKRTKEIIGAHLLSAQASETINIFATAINNNMTADEFKKMIFTYPTYSNDLKNMFKNEL
ncbi:dihydrolipoyl dehydrogenase family protein [Polaribacter sargassicola]|uniref:dihydrolipoyl dehydrogenase family protein n=1 Tax=Polaribacter sargassicola TaxID=2836891 RepID=UPI001F164DC4|nr:NAD(P)/FAD-dependent oxidoreductase [Polaribacter sp. DS7-9]MCG1037354.1 NAD(P)/FAD-dependent oxidoreductase [Polaribacter sp. DS7-9]